jgi:uncharacterized membrane protein YoaK (UPF0700 family)
MAGGSIDAFVYLNHGHVFAAVMTGDTILLAVGLLQHDWSRSLHNLVPIIAFLAGLFCAHLFHYVTRSRYVILGLAGEALGLFAVSFLPGSFPDRVFVAFVSFLTAYQVASFRKEEGKRYNSTFVTADLRSLVDGLDDILQPAKRRQGLQKARQLGLIFLSFFTGALIAAFLAPRIYNHTLWFADLLLTSVVAFILVRSRSSNLSPHE